MSNSSLFTPALLRTHSIVFFCCPCTKLAESFSVLSSRRRQDVLLRSFRVSSFHSRTLLQAIYDVHITLTPTRGQMSGWGDKWPVTPQTAQQQHRQRRRGMRAALVCNCYNWVRPVRTNKPPEWLVETHREENNSSGGGHLGNDGRATAQSLRLIFICLCFIDTGRGRAVHVPCSVNDRRSRLSLKCHHPTEVTFRRGV